MRGKRWEGGEEGIGNVGSGRRECNLLYQQDFSMLAHDPRISTTTVTRE